MTETDDEFDFALSSVGIVLVGLIVWSLWVGNMSFARMNVSFLVMIGIVNRYLYHYK